MRKLTIALLVVATLMAVAACMSSPRQRLMEQVTMAQEALPIYFGHGLAITGVDVADSSFCLTIWRDAVDCYLPDSILCSESFLLRLLAGERSFYRILQKAGVGVRVEYVTGADTLTSTLMPERLNEVAYGVGLKPMDLLEVTRAELTALRRQLPRMVDESLCLYDAFVDGRDVTFVYIYPDEVVKDMPELSEEELSSMKEEHIVGLLESYSQADLEAFFNEHATFVYQYTTQTRTICSVVVEASELLSASI